MDGLRLTAITTMTVPNRVIHYRSAGNFASFSDEQDSNNDDEVDEVVSDIPDLDFKMSSLRPMFPARAARDVRAALIQTKGDVEEAIDLLIEVKGKSKFKRIRPESQESVSDPDTPIQPWKRICKTSSDSEDDAGTSVTDSQITVPYGLNSQRSDARPFTSAKQQQIEFLQTCFKGHSEKDLRRVLSEHNWVIADATVALSASTIHKAVAKINKNKVRTKAAATLDENNVQVPSITTNENQNLSNPMTNINKDKVVLEGGGQFVEGQNYLIRHISGQSRTMTWRQGHFVPPPEENTIKVPSISTNQNRNLLSNPMTNINKDNVVLEGGGQFEEGQNYLIRHMSGQSRTMTWRQGHFVPPPEENTIQHSTIDSSQRRPGQGKNPSCHGRGHGHPQQGQAMGMHMAHRNMRGGYRRSPQMKNIRPQSQMIQHQAAPEENTNVKTTLEALIEKTKTEIQARKQRMQRNRVPQQSNSSTQSDTKDTGRSGIDKVMMVEDGEINVTTPKCEEASNNKSVSMGAHPGSVTSSKGGKDSPSTVKDVKTTLEALIKKTKTEIQARKQRMQRNRVPQQSNSSTQSDTKDTSCSGIDKVLMVEDGEINVTTPKCEAASNSKSVSSGASPVSVTSNKGGKDSPSTVKDIRSNLDALIEKTKSEIRARNQRMQRNSVPQQSNSSTQSDTQDTGCTGIDKVPMVEDDDVHVTKPKCEAASNAKSVSSGARPGSVTSNKGGKDSPSTVKDMDPVLLEIEKLKDQKLCKICLENQLSMTFIPCGHLATCEECSKALTECPICRKPIKDKMKVFWS